MLRAFPRYQARIISKTGQTIAAPRERGELGQGPHLPLFERALGNDVRAEQTANSIQLPLSSSPSREEGDRVASVVHDAVQAA